MITIIALLFVLVVVFAAAAAYLSICVLHHKARADNLERWLRRQLGEIDLEIAYLSPQAATVVRSLKCALPTLAPIDIGGLRRHLAQLVREHEAHVTEHVQHWCKVRADIAAKAAQGEELPGIGGGAS